MNVFLHYCLNFSANDCVFSLNEIQKVYCVVRKDVNEEERTRKNDVKGFQEVSGKGTKNITNMARMRKPIREMQTKGTNREVKRRCRRDRRVYVESEAERAEETGERGNARTLHKITRKL